MEKCNHCMVKSDWAKKVFFSFTPICYQKARRGANRPVEKDLPTPHKRGQKKVEKAITHSRTAVNLCCKKEFLISLVVDSTSGMNRGTKPRFTALLNQKEHMFPLPCASARPEDPQSRMAGGVEWPRSP